MDVTMVPSPLGFRQMVPFQTMDAALLDCIDNCLQGPIPLGCQADPQGYCSEKCAGIDPACEQNGGGGQ